MNFHPNLPTQKPEDPLQKMFQLVGLAEQAGSGLNKVYSNWRKQHWRLPELLEQREPDQTILRLRTVSLLPDETLQELDARFGQRFHELSEAARMALATVSIEGSITHARLREMCADHPKELSKTLGALVDQDFLISKGATRATVYYFSNANLGSSNDGLIASSGSEAGATLSSEHLRSSSEHLKNSSEHSGPQEADPRLLAIAEPVRRTKKCGRTIVEETIINLCRTAPIPLPVLALLLNRDSAFLRVHYLSRMLVSNLLQLKFPEKPNHPHQAYTAAPP